jgi:protein-tyrosine phosphatase
VTERTRHDEFGAGQPGEVSAPLYVDLHCHLLPGIDDGARDLDAAVAMASLAVADGVRVIACTPHVIPGLYNFDSAFIAERVGALQAELLARGIDLLLVPGGDVHVVVDLPARLVDGRAPTLGASRFFLMEPPHDVCPPRLDRVVDRVLAAGFTPIVTHPERLAWVDRQERLMDDLHAAGCLFQITAASFTGRFGTQARERAGRYLSRGQVDLVASDAHDPVDRVPMLSRARTIVAGIVGEDAAEDMFCRRPAAILSGQVLTWTGGEDDRPVSSRRVEAVEAGGETT